MNWTVDNHSVYGYAGGRPWTPGQPTVVMIHGAANDHSIWAWQSRALAHHGFNVLAPDLPGHGRSCGTPLPSVEALAEWLIQLLDAAKVSNVAFAGHSMGSLIVLETAARLGTRVSKLALLGCAAPMAVSEALLDAALNDPLTAIDLVTGWSHTPRSLLDGGAIPGLWLPGTSRALMRRAAQGVLHRDLLNCNQYSGGLTAASKVTAPALIVSAERDLMTPRKASRELMAQLTDWREVLIADAGHSMMSEQGAAVLDALSTFFRD